MKKIPDETIGRLFYYLRALVCLEKEGIDIVRSSRLSEICDINPSIIRKDLSYFGDFGKRGVGYNVSELKKEIRKILNIAEPNSMALIGVGNIGKAMLSFSGFRSEGFRITMAFDKDQRKIGSKIKQVIVDDIANLEKKIQSENIQLVILTVPEKEAPELAKRLAKAGVRAILSFAPCQLKMPTNIKVTCIDLSSEIARLIYYSTKFESID